MNQDTGGFSSSRSGKFTKMLKQRLSFLSYFFLSTNLIGPTLYATLLLIDIAFGFLFPLEVLLNYKQADLADPTITKALSEEEIYAYRYEKFNIFKISFRESDIGLFITDACNAYIVVVYVMCMVAFFKFNKDLSEINKVDRNHLSFLSSILLFTSRFFSYIIMTFQLQAINCVFSPIMCNAETSQVRFYLACLGLLGNLGLIYFQITHMNTYYPIINCPWAKPAFTYSIIHRLFQIVNSLVLSMAEVFIGPNTTINIKPYLLLLVLLALQTPLVWMSANKIVSYNLLVERVLIIRDVALWCIIFFAFIIEILEEPHTYLSFIIFIILTIVLTISINLRKYAKLRRPVIEGSIQKLSEIEEFQLAITLLLFARESKGSEQAVLLKNFYHRHMWMCSEMQCPCKKPVQTKDKSQFQDLHEHKSTILGLKDENELSSLTKILEIIFYQFKSNNDNPSLRQLEIFLLNILQNQVYSAYYKLLEMKTKVQAVKHKDYKFLKMLLEDAAYQENNKYNQIDIEKIMTVEYQFLEYKRIILETSLAVQKFWQQLLNEKGEINEIIVNGKIIVVLYLLQQEQYDKIIQKRPDFIEVVQYNLQFCTKVMNFEMEGLQAQSYLKKIMEKQKILKSNKYAKSKGEMGIIVVSDVGMRKNQITQINKRFEEIVGQQSQKLVNQHLNIIIPKKVAVGHDQIVSNYIKRPDTRAKQEEEYKIFIKRFNETITPVKAYLQITISEKYGMLLICMVDTYEKVTINQIDYDAESACNILGDDNGVIMHATQNFHDKYFNVKDGSLEDYSLTFEDLFPELLKFSDEQLKHGVETRMYKNVWYHNPEQRCLVDVKLTLFKYNFARNNVKLWEAIFIENVTQFQTQQNIYDGHDNNIENLAYEKAEKRFHEEEKNFDDYQQFMQREQILLSASVSSASSSGGNSILKDMLSIKNMLNITTLPPSLLTLKKAIIVFFLILIATALAMLSVTLISHDSWHTDQEYVKDCIFMERELGSLRLVFRNIISMTQSGNRTIFLTFEDQFFHLEEFFENFKVKYESMINAPYSDQELKEMLTEAKLTLHELQVDGTVSSTNQTFITGIQQYISKFSNFLLMDEAQQNRTLRNFTIRDTMSANLTSSQRDAWFLLMNGKDSIREYTLLLGKLYLNQSQSKELVYRQTVLIITAICVFLAILATITLIPITFNLDNEEMEVINYWLMIQDSTKRQVVTDIQDFFTWIAAIKKQEKLDLKGGQSSSPRKHLNNKKSSGGTTTTRLIEDDQSIDYSNSSDRSLLFPPNIPSQDFNNNQKKTMKSFSNFDQFSSQFRNLPSKNATAKLYQTVKGSEEFPNKPKSLFAIKSANNIEKIQPLPDHNEWPSLYQNPVQPLHSKLAKNIKKNNNKLPPVFVGSLASSDRVDLMDQSSPLENPPILQLSRIPKSEKTQNKAELRKKALSLFRVQKFKKIFFLSCFILFIIAFIVGKFVLTDFIITESTDALNLHMTYTSRISCLVNAQAFMMESFAQNKSLKIGGFKDEFDGTLEGYIKDYCFQIEDRVLDHLRSPPNQLMYVINDFRDLNSINFCNHLFDKAIIDRLAKCQTDMNSIMKNGLRNVLQQAYYHIMNENMEFIQSKRQTADFIAKHIYALKTWEFMDVTFDFLVTSTYHMSAQVDYSIDLYLDYVLDFYYTLFAVYEGLMVLCLVIGLRKVISALKNVVLRTRLLLKVIPIEELRLINNIKKEKALRREQGYLHKPPQSRHGSSQNVI